MEKIIEQKIKEGKLLTQKELEKVGFKLFPVLFGREYQKESVKFWYYADELLDLSIDDTPIEHIPCFNASERLGLCDDLTLRLTPEVLKFVYAKAKLI